MPDKKLILIPSILAGVIVVWVVMFFLPVQKQSEQLGERLSFLEEKQRKEIPESRVRMMQAVVDSLNARLDNFNARIFPEERLLDLGRTVEGVGRRYGMTLVSIAPDYGMLSLLSQSNETVSELPMTMVFEGSFSGFAEFMDGMEEFPFLIRIHEASIEKEEESASSLEIQLRGVVVLRKERSNDYGLANEKDIDRT